MDSETALLLVKRGATLLLLDVPQYTLVGIDTQMFSVGPACRGIKMIPPGPHVVYYCSSCRDGQDFSPIAGFFVDAGESEVFVRRWDQQEWLATMSDEKRDIVMLSEIWSLINIWVHMILAIMEIGSGYQITSNRDIIQRHEPIGGDITVESEPEMVKSISKTAVENTLDEQIMNSKFTATTDKSQYRGSYYTSIPHVFKCRGVQGHELTSLNLDKTRLLESILEKYYGGSEDCILDELQFAFIVFLMGQSFQGFLQWKSLGTLFLGCTEAFIKVIYHQLKYGLEKQSRDRRNQEHVASALLDESWLSTDSFLHRLCKDFSCWS